MADLSWDALCPGFAKIENVFDKAVIALIMIADCLYTRGCRG